MLEGHSLAFEVTGESADEIVRMATDACDQYFAGVDYRLTIEVAGQYQTQDGQWRSLVALCRAESQDAMIDLNDQRWRPS